MNVSDVKIIQSLLEKEEEEAEEVQQLRSDACHCKAWQPSEKPRGEGRVQGAGPGHDEVPARLWPGLLGARRPTRGLTWVGDSVAQQLSRPEKLVDVQVLRARVEELNSLVEGARVQRSAVGGAVHARFVADEMLPLTFFQAMAMDFSCFPGARMA